MPSGSCVSLLATQVPEAFRGWTTRDSSDEATLDLYADGVVIWAAPSPYWSLLHHPGTADRITAYLDDGGRLFLTGQLTAFFIRETELLEDYIGATYLELAGSDRTLNGRTGDPIGDGLTLDISGGDGADNQILPCIVNPISPTQTVLTYTQGGTAAVSADGGTYRVVHLAFGFEAINTATDRQVVMARVLGWLTGSPVRTRWSVYLPLVTKGH